MLHITISDRLSASALQNLLTQFISRRGLPLMPRRAPEGLNGYARRGDAGRHRVFRKGWEALSENPVQSLRSAGIKRHGVAFSLDTFFWPRKRKYLGCRAETRL